MESLLSLAFSNISSRQSVRIRKGLRQIEGLLAQICLSTSAHPVNRRSSVVYGPSVSSKKLTDLGEDPAFMEFYRLQDGFEWNVTTHLITCLERLLSMPPNASNDNLLTSALYLLQGMLILHPPSTSLFNQELHMVVSTIPNNPINLTRTSLTYALIKLLLDLLSPTLPSDLQSLALSTILLAILDNPRNARVFEKVNGILAISALLKGHNTADAVRIHALELLYTYLLPDEHENMHVRSESFDSGYDTDTMRRAPGEQYFSDEVAVAVNELVPVEEAGAAVTKTDEEKEKMVSCHLGDIGYLFEAFELNDIFGSA